MKFTFDYEETLTRRVTIEADNFAEATKELYRRIDNEEIVLGAEDFAGGKISIPAEQNFLPHIERCGETMEDVTDLDIVIDYW